MAEPSLQLPERFTERATLAVGAAQTEAMRLGNPHAQPAHLILGLFVEKEGLGASVLESFGVTYEAAVEAILGTVPPEPTSADTKPGISAALRKILELALREALSLGHNYIGTEHLLLALVRKPDDATGTVLEHLSLDGDKVRNEVIRQLSQGRRPRQKVRKPEPKQSNESQIEAVPTHQDRPADRDALGRRRLAEVLGERIRRVREEDTEASVDGWRERRDKRRRDTAAASASGGFLVHVHAPWGAGKSSLLRFLAVDLRNRSNPDRSGPWGWFPDFLRRRKVGKPSLSQWIVVEFSAWEHQRLAPPWWWLLSEVQRSCTSELWKIDRGRWLIFWARDLGWRLWNARAAVITTALVLAVAVVAWLNAWFGLDVGSLNALQKVLLTVASATALASTLLGLASGTGRWLAIGSAAGADRFLRRSQDPLGVYRRRFRWLVRSCGHPMTIFIDDLDRCRPDYVVELLEGIQTLFMAEPVTYVVAADRTWLCQSFATTYEDFRDTVGEPGRPLGFLFLEKTFQISLEIPPMSKTDRERYWAELLRGASEPPESDPRPHRTSSAQALASAHTAAEVEDRIGDILAEGPADEEVLIAAMRRLNAPEMQEQLEKLLLEFAPLLENNPRSMKRLMNAYGIERDRLLREGRLLTKTERRQLALLTILRMRWPLLAEHLRSHPEDFPLCTTAGRLPLDHPFEAVLRDRELRELFGGEVVAEQLRAEFLVEFPPEKARN